MSAPARKPHYWDRGAPAATRKRPGRSAEQTFVSLSTVARPQLLALTNGLSGIIFEVDKDKLRVLMAHRRQ